MNRWLIIFLFLLTLFLAGEEEEEGMPRAGLAFSSEQIITSLREVYSPDFKHIRSIGSDLSFELNGETFYFDEGRFLPESALGEEAGWGSYPFYNYSPEYEPEIRILSEEEKAMFDNYLNGSEYKVIGRHSGFYQSLYRIHSHLEADNLMEKIDFLGFQVKIHPDLADALQRINDDLMRQRNSSPELDAYINSLDTITGYNWRTIAGSASLSNHSFGIAVDLVPLDYKKKQAYWLWSSEIFPEWFAIPWEERYRPPEIVVKAFEAEGFIWGGKWLFFDSIHFEYRPEILILNGIDFTSTSSVSGMFSCLECGLPGRAG